MQEFNFSLECPGSQCLERLMCIDALMLVLEGKRHQLSDIFKSIWSILRFLFFMNTFLKIFLCSACVTNYKGQDCKMCSVHAYT